MEKNSLIKLAIAGAVVLVIVWIIVFFVFPLSMMNSDIRFHKAVDLIPEEQKANYCSLDSDCEFTGYCRPIASYHLQSGIIVNKNEAPRIKKMIESVSEGWCVDYIAPKAEDIACENHIGDVNLTRKMCIDKRYIS